MTATQAPIAVGPRKHRAATPPSRLTGWRMVTAIVPASISTGIGAEPRARAAHELASTGPAVTGPSVTSEAVTLTFDMHVAARIPVVTEAQAHGGRLARVTGAQSDDTPVVFVVDDDVSVRESLDLLIRSAGWRPETFTSAEEFLARPRARGPSCLVLDVTLPDLNGLDLQQRIIDRADMPIIFITGYGDVPTTVQAMKAGAAGFLTKPLSTDVLLEAVAQAIGCSRAAVARETVMRTLRECHASLTPRERQTMALVVSGLLNKQIAARLGISEITVKAHRGRVMRKMRVDSLADLVRLAAALDVPLARTPDTKVPTDTIVQ